jgi:hypothetical protein
LQPCGVFNGTYYAAAETQLNELRTLIDQVDDNVFPAILRRNPHSVVVPFDTAGYEAKVDPQDTILSQAERHQVARQLLSHAAFRVGGHFAQEQVVPWFAPQADLQPPVEQLTGLYEVGLREPPGFDLFDLGQPQHRVPMGLDQPLAALVLPLVLVLDHGHLRVCR